MISVPGIGARGDLTFLQLPIGYLFGRIGVAIWLLPGYFRGEQETAYARLETRFGTPTRRMLSLVFLVTRFLADGVRVFAGAIPLALLTGWSVPTAIVVMGAITLVYTWLGGHQGGDLGRRDSARRLRDRRDRSAGHRNAPGGRRRSRLVDGAAPPASSASSIFIFRSPRPTPSSAA